MARSIRLKENTYLDSESIVYGHQPLNKCLFDNIKRENPPSNNDLNNALAIGQYTYYADTLNSPYKQNGTDDQYGIVLVFATTDDITIVARWVIQIALTTWGNIFMRTNINSSGWTRWMKVGYV